MAYTPVSVIGKRLLIGISLLDAQGKVDSRIQVHGTVKECTPQYILVVAPDGEEFYMPPVLSQIKLSPPEAVYTIQETGEELSDIDGVVSLTMTPAD